MKDLVKCLIVIAGILIFATGCEDDASSSSHVRFENRSANKIVYPVWDGSQVATLAPGERSDYRDANPGTHTLQWKDAANNKNLTSMAWPNLVRGDYYTFPY